MTVVPAPGSSGWTRECPFAPPRQYGDIRENGELGEVKLSSGRTAWLVTRYRDVVTLLTDPRFSSTVNTPPVLPDETPTPAWFFGMDAPAHTHYRRLLTGSFTLRAARRMIPRIQRAVQAQLNMMRTAGSPTDFVEAFSWPFPRLVVHDLLGANADEVEAVEAAFDVIEGEAATRGQSAAAYGELWHAAVMLARRKRTEPGDDVLSNLLAHPDFTVEEAAAVAIALRMAGHAPVAHVMGFGMFTLLRNPALVTALATPATAGAVVDELLRYLPTNNLGVVRVALDDVRLGEHVVPRGSLVFVSLPTANRDPERFTDPDRLDPARSQSQHLAFGHGAHKCVGQNLARVIFEVAFPSLFRELPGLRLAVAEDAVPMIDSATSYSVAELPVAW